MKKDLSRLCRHVDARVTPPTKDQPATALPSVELATLVADWSDLDSVSKENATALLKSLEKTLPHIDEGNSTEENRYDRIVPRSRAQERLRSRHYFICCDRRALTVRGHSLRGRRNAWSRANSTASSRLNTASRGARPLTYPSWAFSVPPSTVTLPHPITASRHNSGSA